MGKLTATEFRALRKRSGKHYDGDGLLLHVISASRAAWFFRYQRQGKERMIGLGNANLVTLAEAREKAGGFRKQIADGLDPLEARRAEEKAVAIAEARAITFAEAVETYLGAHEASWKNPKHRQQWRNTLATYVEPEIGKLPCAEIATRQVLKVLEPIWTKKPETAARVRGRIEAILSYATVRGWREGPNPAVWRGHLQIMLAPHGRLRRVKHHAALDWRDGYTFMQALHGRESYGARALEFAILTAARSSEVRGATWDEIDLDAAIWTVPAGRMKGGREHRVPLSEPVLAILHAMTELKDGSGLVFIGQKYGVSMSDMTLTAVLRRMGRGDLTRHGFRSTFRDWAAETTSCPNHVVEQALAHAIGDKVEAAYRRGDLFEKRTALMTDWAAFLDRPAAKVVRPLRRNAQPAEAGAVWPR